jgi:tetratricopeptide (TPR) repeat protein
VLCGRVVKHEDLLFISLELVDARDDSHIWGSQHARKLGDLIPLQQLMSREIADQLSLQPNGDDQHRLSRRHTQNVDAYHDYLKGRYYFNKLTLQGVEKAIEHLQKAVETDSNYALAYAALGDAYNYLGKPLKPGRRWSRRCTSTQRWVKHTRRLDFSNSFTIGISKARKQSSRRRYGKRQTMLKPITGRQSISPTLADMKMPLC